MLILLYYFALPFLYGVSLLPFKVLFVLSNVLYLMIYRLFGYRRKVVAQNLKNAFPSYSQAQLLALERKFYRYFCDLVLESLKVLTISKEGLRKQVTFVGGEVFDSLLKAKKSIVVVMGHQGNWELVGARFALETYHELFAIYHPLKNKQFDQLVYAMRTRFGNKLYAMKDAFRGMIENKNRLTATTFIADQTPSPKNAQWVSFLNQDTPVFKGTAKIAKKLNYPIVYISVTRPNRGEYVIHAENLIEDPSKYSEEEITEIHTRRLEKDIVKHPENWLWSHRRWKHQRNLSTKKVKCEQNS